MLLAGHCSSSTYEEEDFVRPRWPMCPFKAKDRGITDRCVATNDGFIASTKPRPRRRDYSSAITASSTDAQSTSIVLRASGSA